MNQEIGYPAFLYSSFIPLSIDQSLTDRSLYKLDSGHAPLLSFIDNNFTTTVVDRV
jgi:hypothetical protein